MQQIADWLKKLGMSEYAERFAENRIDVSVLRHLTDQDLKDIGVALGHRRKMLAAIHGSTSPTPTAVEPTAVVEPKSQEAAERRQVTVMFSDLVGSTALSARMDRATGAGCSESRRLFRARAANHRAAFTGR
jgi:class 3 adenylate cyclase